VFLTLFPIVCVCHWVSRTLTFGVQCVQGVQGSLLWSVL
jgi:hypothetical protein